MKCEFYHYYFAEDVDECNDVLLSAREIAENAGITYETFMDRLEQGCPLVIAAQMPEDWSILSVDADGYDNPIFHIAEKTLHCSGEDLLRHIHEMTD